MLPGPKVGLIIGKSGKTIKQLQEQSGAKMVVIQDGPNTEYVSIKLQLWYKLLLLVIMALEAPHK